MPEDPIGESGLEAEGCTAWDGIGASSGRRIPGRILRICYFIVHAREIGLETIPVQHDGIEQGFPEIADTGWV